MEYWHWNEPNWNDRLLEQEVVELLNARRVKARDWPWPILKPYNGSSGETRIIGWKKVWAAIHAGRLPKYFTCSVCKEKGPTQYHNEDYLRPLNAKPICKGCHGTLHKRFKNPRPWLWLVAQTAFAGDWYVNLRMTERTFEEANAELSRLGSTPLEDASIPSHGAGAMDVCPNLVSPHLYSLIHREPIREENDVGMAREPEPAPAPPRRRPPPPSAR